MTEPTCRSCGKPGVHNCAGLQFHAQKLDLKPPTVEETIKHYEVREREVAQWIRRRLEERILDWNERSMPVEEAAGDPDNEVLYGFDQGYLAGLRVAISITEDMSERLAPKPESL